MVEENRKKKGARTGGEERMDQVPVCKTGRREQKDR
jgi:hypothetical protein